MDMDMGVTGNRVLQVRAVVLFSCSMLGGLVFRRDAVLYNPLLCTNIYITVERGRALLVCIV